MPRIKETCDNIKLLFELTNINNIPFKFVSDFKTLLIVNGQQTASASFPCPYCFISLKDLRTRKDLDNEQHVDMLESEVQLDLDDCALSLKSYGDLRKDYNKYSS